MVNFLNNIRKIMQLKNSLRNIVKLEIFYYLKTDILLPKFKEQLQTQNMTILLLFIEAKSMVFA